MRIPFGREFMMHNGGISIPLMKDVLNLLPSDATFAGCGNDGSSCLDYMFFISEQFKDVQPGEIVPNFDVMFTRNSDGTITTFKLNVPGVQIICNHKWKSYVGIRDNFEFCETCGVRK